MAKLADDAGDETVLVPDHLTPFRQRAKRSLRRGQ
jgi:hypothetical protein